VLYAGSDDGRVHVSRDGGSSWRDVSAAFPGIPPERWITCIEASHFDAGTAYLTLDRHRNEDRAPYVFRTQDHGATWKPLANNLPASGPIHVVREDPRNRDLLYVGTEFGLFVSLDRGGSWLQVHNGLPTVAVHDLVVHPRERELVIGTHGRSLYVLDVAPLQELTAKVRGEAAHLFDVTPATVFRYRGSHGLGTGKNYLAPNPPFGATIYYYLKEAVGENVRVAITDAAGNPVGELSGPGTTGLHRVQWNLVGLPSLFPPRPATLVAPGDYAARLKLKETVLARKIRVEAEE
jgi:hypothetical protein